MEHSNHNEHHHGHHMELMASTTVATTPMKPISGHHYGHDHAKSMSHADHGMNYLNSGVHHMMSMSFHFGCNETILFDWWHIETVSGLLGSILIIFLIALLYEALKHYREYLLWKTYHLLEYRPVTINTQNAADILSAEATVSATTTTTIPNTNTRMRIQPTILSLTHLFQTILHLFQVTLSFVLMLIFMTYNVWLCATVVIGASIGYFLFCWKKAVIIEVTEQCH